jgi:DNA-binding response OmpR family regulator
MDVTRELNTPDLFNPAPDTVIPDLPRPRASAPVATPAHPGFHATRPMRFAGLTMYAETGRIEWRGRAIRLPRDEQRVLVSLMQHAGQIIEYSRLAASCGASVDALEKCVRSLKLTLRDEGVTCQPCKVEGIGFILWPTPALR